MADVLTRVLGTIEDCFEPHKQNMREPFNWLDQVDIVGDSSHLLAFAAIPQSSSPPSVNAYLIEQIDGRVIDSFVFPPMVEAGWINGVGTIYSTDLPRITASIEAPEGLRINSALLNECKIALRQADMLASAQVSGPYAPAAITTWKWQQDIFEHKLFLFDQACGRSKTELIWNYASIHRVYISHNQIICIPKLVAPRLSVSVFDLAESTRSGYFSSVYEIIIKLSTPSLIRVLGITDCTLHVLDLSRPLIVNIPLNKRETVMML